MSYSKEEMQYRNELIEKIEAAFDELSEIQTPERPDLRVVK